MDMTLFSHAKVINPVIVTAGDNYLDIDAYACMVAMAELLRMRGENAVAYSTAACNYSICPSLLEEGQILRELPVPEWEMNSRYIIVDVSDPEYLKKSVPLENVVAVYDHHIGFEDYWRRHIGENARIEFIGAAATLIYREWKKSGLHDAMSHATARLLIAAILDNTLNLTSSNTTSEDVDVFRVLCEYAGVGPDWCAAYFSEVQESIESNLRDALLNDTKFVRCNPVLPNQVAQLCVWDADSILCRLPEIRGWFAESWMLNIIDLQRHCSWFVCDDTENQRKISSLFDVTFENGVAKTAVSYLRKEIIKKTMEDKSLVELGFIHGRFQLFHNDHLNYALLAKQQCKKLIVGITSPENATLIREEIDPHRSEAASNPFTYYERYNMIKLALLEAGIKREDFEIVPYPIERPEILYNYVPLHATSFFTIYDKWGYEKLNRLKSLGYGTVVLFDDREKKMCSTEIREKIVADEDWKQMVPEAVYQYIVDNDLTAKVKQLLNRD